ncbi:hypothetical protein YC2023_047656 [Brassica napus]
MSSNDRDHTWPNGQDHHSFWPNPSRYDPTSKIMLAAVISSSAVILIIFILHLYARFILHRRREASSFRGLSVVLRHPLQTPKRDLNPTEQDTARELPNCRHVFHVDCIDTWLTTCSTCPVCRNEVQPRLRLEPEPREGPVGDGASGSPPTAPPSLEEVRLNSSSVSRLDSFRRILTRERSSNRINHSCVGQEHLNPQSGKTVESSISGLHKDAEPTVCEIISLQLEFI